MADTGQGAQHDDPALINGDIDIRIAADGTWFHEGGPIRRKKLVKLFASVLKRDDAGDYWLETPVERARIRVEDAPFVALEMTVSGSGRDQCLTFRTNIDAEIMKIFLKSGDYLNYANEHLDPEQIDEVDVDAWLEEYYVEPTPPRR